MSANPTRTERRFTRPVLAAAVGLGDVTLQRTQATPGRSIRAGGHVRCDLPYPSRYPISASRRGETWVIAVPRGTQVLGADVNDGLVKLYDWDAGVTLVSGQAWLKLWPTRAEPFRDAGALGRTAGFIGRTLPLLWIALAITVGIGSLGLWASTSMRGNPAVFALGSGGGGLDPDRVASFGDGDFAAGTEAPWSSIPTPDPIDEDAAEDALAEEEAEETQPEEPEPSVTPQPEEVAPEVADVAEQAESDETVDDSDDAVAEATSEGVEGGVEGGSKAAGGGGGSFGLGGGTDDGFNDRSESASALERLLMSCMDGRRTHRVQMAVDTDGSVHSLDYKGVWTDAERECVSRAIDDWAFPVADEVYEVSLRLRKA